jgi:hypothetical protein
MFAACTNTDDLTQQIPAENERIPLTIGANYGENPNVTVRTRSTNQAIQGDTISRYVDMGLFVLTDGQTHVHQKETSPSVFVDDPYDYEFFNIAAKTSNIDATNKRTEVGADDPTTNALVYPSDKAQGINLYAYAPYNSSPGITDIDASTTTTNVIAVSVQTDQSTDRNYIKSDVLWGCVGENAIGNTIETSAGDGKSYPLGFTGHPEAVINGNNYVAAKTAATDGFVQGTTTPSVVAPKVIIPMLHRAAKIVVKLKVNGMPVDKLKGAKVTIQSPTAGELRIDNGTLTATGASSDIIMTDKLGYKRDYTVASTDPGYETELSLTGGAGGTEDTEDAGLISEDTEPVGTPDGVKDKITGYICSAVVMPHALTANAKLFDIQLADGAAGAYSTKYTYFNPSTLTGVTEFKSGKVYTYTITVKASGLDIVATVEDWAVGGTDTGNAVLQ